MSTPSTPAPAPGDTVIFDVDGTLVDSTYHHALAWHRAFKECSVDVPLWRVHRAVGMGADRLVAAVSDDSVERRHGDRLRALWEAAYDDLLPEVDPLPGAVDLVRRLHDRGFTVAVGSSGKPRHTDAALDSLGVRDLFAAVTTSEDAPESKPAADILRAALQAAGGSRAVVVGDTPYDVEAASALGAPCVAVRTGGFGADELQGAGGARVADGLEDLLALDWGALVAANG
ncbi:HAD family hydrolase [Phycicoccus ginsengisoli]